MPIGRYRRRPRCAGSGQRPTVYESRRGLDVGVCPVCQRLIRVTDLTGRLRWHPAPHGDAQS